MMEFARFPAIKTAINTITQSTFVQEMESMSYLLTSQGQKLYRVNVLATVLRKEEQGNITHILIDDGTAQITTRFFEQHPLLPTLTTGDIIMIIGRGRVYNNERYISPEIIKRVNPLWLKIRKKEVEESIEPVKENLSEEMVEQEKLLPREKIIQIIKQSDDGQGVAIEEIIEKISLPDVETILKKMLEEGEIFQIIPGKVKML